MAELFREYFEEELGWTEFLNEEGADDSPEPYRSLLKEKDSVGHYSIVCLYGVDLCSYGEKSL